MRLIARWNAEQNPEADEPVCVRWEDGTPATPNDFKRIDTGSQSDPHILGDGVEFSYATTREN